MACLPAAPTAGRAAGICGEPSAASSAAQRDGTSPPCSRRACAAEQSILGLFARDLVGDSGRRLPTACPGISAAGDDGPSSMATLPQSSGVASGGIIDGGGGRCLTRGSLLGGTSRTMRLTVGCLRGSMAICIMSVFASEAATGLSTGLGASDSKARMGEVETRKTSLKGTAR
eukprot:scaffold12054_cov126-Isochrysis_galbana.AAC.5